MNERPPIGYSISKLTKATSPEARLLVRSISREATLRLALVNLCGELIQAGQSIETGDLTGDAALKALADIASKMLDPARSTYEEFSADFDVTDL